MFYDQFPNARLVQKLGVGIGLTKGLNKITAQELANAITSAEAPDARQKAKGTSEGFSTA